jgi:hypothetical protein
VFGYLIVNRKLIITQTDYGLYLCRNSNRKRRQGGLRDRGPPRRGRLLLHQDPFVDVRNDTFSHNWTLLDSKRKTIDSLLNPNYTACILIKTSVLPRKISYTWQLNILMDANLHIRWPR